jgi:serine/threonine-protein kinase
MKYEILEELGRGKFGRVYRGISRRTGEMVAIKCETEPVLLKHEASMLHYLHRAGCREGVPSIYWFGKLANEDGSSSGSSSGGDLRALVMTFMDGGSLETVAIASDGKNDRRLLHYWRRLVAILRHIHSAGVVHRDIKPANCMLRGGDIFLVDFGLANIIDHVDEEKKTTTTTMTNNHVVGTPTFMSAHVLSGCRPTRRDDLASLGYTILYCLDAMKFRDEVFGTLPEDGGGGGIAITDARHPRNVRILEQKRAWLNEHSGDKADCFMRACHSLRINEIPEYDFLCSLLEFPDEDT